MGVELREDAVVVRGVLTHRVPWDSVQSINVHKVLGERRVVLAATGVDYQLRAPATGPLSPDHEFNAKLETLRSWSAAHGGCQEPSPARPRLSRSGRQRLQLALSVPLGLYAALNLLIVIVILGRGTITILPAALVASIGVGLLYPTRPQVVRLLRRRR